MIKFFVVARQERLCLIVNRFDKLRGVRDVGNVNINRLDIIFIFVVSVGAVRKNKIESFPIVGGAVETKTFALKTCRHFDIEIGKINVVMAQSFFNAINGSAVSVD